MIQTKHIVHFQIVIQPFQPPIKSSLLAIIPIVHRISPILSSFRKSVRRNSCHKLRRQILIHHKHFWVLPHIAAFIRHINRQIAKYFYPQIIRVIFQFEILLVKQSLNERIVFNLITKQIFVIIDAFFLAIFYLIWKIQPRFVIKMLFQSFEQTKPNNKFSLWKIFCVDYLQFLVALKSLA